MHDIIFAIEFKLTQFAQLTLIPLKLDKEMSRHLLSAAGIFGMIGAVRFLRLNAE
jgi:hypothetical protein